MVLHIKTIVELKRKHYLSILAVSFVLMGKFWSFEPDSC